MDAGGWLAGWLADWLAGGLAGSGWLAGNGPLRVVRGLSFVVAIRLAINYSPVPKKGVIASLDVFDDFKGL